ncbi:hypothetical protein BH11PSE11_BH11PSE11_35060 [soil metagenome]
MQNTVHFILQGKGGIGKTLVSTMLAQWIKTKAPEGLRCYDTDQENTTFLRYKAMNVKHVPVMNESRIIDPKRFDALIIDILESDGNCVIDNGANTFSPLMSYLLENAAFELLKDSGRKVFIHSIVGGGDTLHDTASGFAATVQSTKTPVVLWENEHFGLLQTPSGKLFIDSQTFGDHAHQVVGRVKLALRNSDTFGADIKKMNTGRLTLDEVMLNEKCNGMEKQRSKTVYRDIYAQLDKIEWEARKTSTGGENGPE